MVVGLTGQKKALFRQHDWGARSELRRTLHARQRARFEKGHATEEANRVLRFIFASVAR
jgi:hypothetical protein